MCLALDQFLSCGQGTKQALSVWKLISIHSGKLSNYSFDDFLPANSLFFLYETPVVWVVYLMNYLLTLFFFFLIFHLVVFLLYVLRNEYEWTAKRHQSIEEAANMTD